MHRNLHNFRIGAKSGIREQQDRARRIARHAADNGANPSHTLELVSQNLARTTRSHGRYAQGAEAGKQQPSSGIKRTGKGANRAAIVATQAAASADALRRYRRAHDRMSELQARLKGRDQGANRRIKGALRLARKLAGKGEYQEAIQALKSA